MNETVGQDTPEKQKLQMELATRRVKRDDDEAKSYFVREVTRLLREERAVIMSSDMPGWAYILGLGEGIAQKEGW